MSGQRPKLLSYLLGVPGALKSWKLFTHSRARLSLFDMRRDYALAGLAEADAPAGEPWPLWERWFEEAVKGGIREPNAMVVATADAASGQPSMRTVLLKGADRRGFVFFTSTRAARGPNSRATRAPRCCSPGTIWSGR